MPSLPYHSPKDPRQFICMWQGLQSYKLLMLPQENLNSLAMLSLVGKLRFHTCVSQLISKAFTISC